MSTKLSDNKPIRPFCIDYSEAKNEVVSAINNIIVKHTIPLYLARDIVADILHQLEKGADMELQAAVKSYEKQMSDYNKTISGGEGDD